MNKPTAQPSSSRNAGSCPAWLCFLIPALLGMLAITGRSFWIDECVTVQFVSQPTFAEWSHDLLSTRIAEAQMPLYLAYLWGWDKVLGHGEWSLRMAALPWFIAGVGLFLYALRGLGRWGWPAVAVTVGSAFVWYYLDEARRYAMVFSAACAVVASLVMLSRQESSRDAAGQSWFRIFLASIVVMSGISILGMLWSGAATLILVLILPRPWLWQRIKSSPWMTGAWVVVLSGLAAYYVSTVLRGARGSDMATTNLQTAAYVGYELLGFTGLGPGRDALREQGFRALGAYAPWLGLYAMATLMVVAAALVSIWKSPWRMRALYIAGVLSLPAAFLLATGVMRHWRVLGRHFSPLLAVLLLVLAIGVANLWRGGRLGRIMATLYLVLALCSAAQVRLAARHHKDDYRAAAALARQALADGDRVWWVAAMEGADYYGLPYSARSPQPDEAYAVFGQPPKELAALPSPDLIVLSRPDIYDHQGGVAAVLSHGGYSQRTNLAGFKIWARNP